MSTRQHLCSQCGRSRRAGDPELGDLHRLVSTSPGAGVAEEKLCLDCFWSTIRVTLESVGPGRTSSSGFSCLGRRTLVRGRESPWWLPLLRFLYAGLFALAALRIARDGADRVLELASPLVLFLVTELVFGRQVRRARWIECSEDGFTLTDGSSRCSHRDEMVTAYAETTRPRYRRGCLVAHRRSLYLWMQDTSVPSVLTRTIRVGEPDPLAKLIARLQCRLYDKARAALEREGRVEERDWRLDRRELTLKVSSSPWTVPVAEVTAVHVVSGELRVWVRGGDRAAAGLPLVSPNAAILGLLLVDRLAERDEAAPREAGSLGHILFEIKPDIGRRILWSSAAAVVIAVGWKILAVGGPAWLGGPLTAGGGVLAVFSWSLWTSWFRCHDLGISMRRGRVRGALLFDEIASLSYSATRRVPRPDDVLVFESLHFEITLSPEEGSPKAPISFGFSGSRPDPNLERLRHELTSLVATRIKGALARAGRVSWTPNLELRREGLVYHDCGILGSPRPIVYPYEKLARYSIQKGVFYLWAEGIRAPVLKEGVASPNFFPGLLVLESLCSATRAGSSTG